MNPQTEASLLQTRRQLFGRSATGIGAVALATLMGENLPARVASAASLPSPGLARGGLTVPGLPSLPHFAPKAKRAIYLHMVGAPPQMDLFDYKPQMNDWFDKDLPDSIRQ